MKKREWVKNAAIILLAGLLVLTFFSNTIMNRNLPEVATQYVTDGSINAKVRGTGTVAANGNHVVKAEQTREIRAVMIKAGQTVEVGDVLFVLGSGEGSELEAAQEQLRQLQLSYQRTALGGTYSDYTADEVRLQAAQRKLLEAEETLRSLHAQGDDSDMVQQLQAELEKATAARDAAKEAYDSTLAEAQSALSAAESERILAEQAVLLKEGWDQNNLTWEQKDYLEHPDKMIRELEDNSPEPTPAPEPEPEPDPGTDPDPDPEEDSGGEIEPLVPVDSDRLEKWKKLKETADAADEAAQALNAVSASGVEAAQRKVDELQQEIGKYTNSPVYREALEAYEEAYTNYLDQKAALDARKNADAKSNASLGLELSDLNRQIEEQKKKIEELSGGEENQVLAKVSGTVQSIDCTSGDTVPKDGVLCVIEVPDMGYTMSFSVTNDQAARLRVGDSATITNYYWGSQITATLASIRVDPKNPQTNKLLTFDISGDVSAGAELTVSVGQRSANYDHVVPKSAIHSDSGGSFVYKIESKSSPLGNRYIARRVPVEILAQDDSMVAVSGELGWGDYVITTSSAPLQNGTMVRLADS